MSNSDEEGGDNPNENGEDAPRTAKVLKVGSMILDSDEEENLRQ